jgi:ribonuclease Z
MVEFAVTIIGSGSAVPMHGRHPSAQVVQYDDHFFLIDCGEGTQLRLREAGIKPFRIQSIFISHLHGDHFFGLPGLLSSYSHLGRTEPLVIYGPAGIQPLLQTIFDYTELRIKYPLQIKEITSTGLQNIFSNDDFEILTFPLKHRIACQGYLFREKKEMIKLNKEIIEKLKLSPAQIKKLLNGEIIGTGDSQISSQEIFLPPWPKISYAYCSDTAYDPQVARMIKGVNVLYHEATFKNELADLAKETGHSTAGDASRIAEEAGVNCLLLGHYSSRYKVLDELLQEAQRHFPNSLLTVEGRRYPLRNLMMG